MVVVGLRLCDEDIPMLTTGKRSIELLEIEDDELLSGKHLKGTDGGTSDDCVNNDLSVEAAVEQSCRVQ